MKRNKHLTTLAALALIGICTATMVGAVSAPQAPASAAGMVCRADTILYNGREPSFHGITANRTPACPCRLYG